MSTRGVSRKQKILDYEIETESVNNGIFKGN